MENQKQKKSAGTVVLVVLLLIVTIAALILATYAWARYTTVETGTATAQVAKWDVTFEEGSNIFSKTYTHVVKDRLAPGMTGSVTMNITSSLTETDYDYRIKMTQLMNKPTNLHFYSDANYTNEIVFANNVEGSTPATTATDKAGQLYGHVAVTGKDASTGEGGHAVKNEDVTIYWKWEYQTADITAFPADIDTSYNITVPTNTRNDETGAVESTANVASTTTKRKRIVHDLNVLLMQKGAIESEANGLAENSSFAVLTGTENGLIKTAIADNKITLAEVKQAINDAIDTVDGMAALTMQFDVELTAIQCDPTTGATEFTQYITPHDYQTNSPKATPSGKDYVE